MSFNAAILKAMRAEGLDLDACIRVLEAGERRPDNTNAIRQARHRAKAKGNGVTVTRDPAPNERDNLTPTHEIPPKPNGLDPKPKKHRLPDDWQPAPFNLGTMAFEIVQRWEPGRMERELAKFRAHYAAAGTKWENWQAVWCKWVNNSDDFQRGRGSGQQPAIGKTSAAIAMFGDFRDDRPM